MNTPSITADSSPVSALSNDISCLLCNIHCLLWKNIISSSKFIITVKIISDSTAATARATGISTRTATTSWIDYFK